MRQPLRTRRVASLYFLQLQLRDTKSCMICCKISEMNNEKVDTATGSATDRRNETERPNNDSAGQNDVEMRPSLNDLPDELLRKIIMSLDGRDWPQVELVSRRFHLRVMDCWESSKIVRLEEFCDNALVFWKNDSEKQDLLRHLLRMIYDRSPNVQSISGFSAIVSELDPRTLEYLTHFQHLKSITFSSCKITSPGLATFLNDSNSRNVLEELCVIDSLGANNLDWNRNHEDELLLRALFNTPDRPALRLRKFRFEKNNCCKGFFLAGLDASCLEILSLADIIELRSVAGLLGRCVELQEFRFRGNIRIKMEYDLQSTKAFLSAILSLPTISLRRFELRNCGSKSDLFSAILSQLGQRHERLESLCILDNRLRIEDRIAPAIGQYFSNLTTLDMDVASVEAGDLAQLMTRMGRLKELGFYHSGPFCVAAPQERGRNVDGDVVRAIVSNVGGLTSLRLYQVEITPENAEMLTEMKELKEVSIHWVETGVETITWYCERFGPKIIRLEIYSRQLTDSLIVSIVNRLTRVRRLLLEVNNITYTALHSIATSCLDMEELLLGHVAYGTLTITASGVQTVLDNCKKLAYVELRNTSVDLEEIVMNKGTRLVKKRNDLPDIVFGAPLYQSYLAEMVDDDDGTW